MSAQAVPEEQRSLEAQFETANDRFKRSFDNWFWGSMIVATLVHFGFFVFWPEMSVADVAYSAASIEAIELPPEIEIPPPPEAIARPATPVITAGAEIDENITIAPTTFESNPVSELPPPPTDAGGADISAAPTFTPFTVRPGILNTEEVVAALTREYPPLLRDAGIGGTVLVHFFVDVNGRVQNTLVAQSSGHKALDDAAIAVAGLYRFSPALNRDKKVPVWIQLPITFQVR